MHQYKIVPSVLLILSLINVVFAVPVVVPEHEVLRRACADMADVTEDVVIAPEVEKQSDELEKRWDTYSNQPWQKRRSSQGPSVGESAQNPSPSLPGSPQTVTHSVQDAGSASASPPSDEEYPHPPFGEGYPSDHESMSSAHASSEGEQAPPTSPADIIGAETSPSGSPVSSKGHPPSDGPGSDIASSMEVKPGSPIKNPSLGELLMMTEESHPGWNPNDWSTSSSEQSPLPPKKTFMNKTKSFFNKLAYKMKFWHRGPEVL